MRPLTIGLSLCAVLGVWAVCFAAEDDTNIGFLKTQLDDEYREFLEALP